jgi:hypothetical protein
MKLTMRACCATTRPRARKASIMSHREAIVDPVTMVTTRIKPRGPFYVCKHARTHPRVFIDIRTGIPAQDDGCYLALDLVTYQASCQARAI